MIFSIFPAIEAILFCGIILHIGLMVLPLAQLSDENYMFLKFQIQFLVPITCTLLFLLFSHNIFLQFLKSATFMWPTMTIIGELLLRYEAYHQKKA